jgi:hypothetical protein
MEALSAHRAAAGDGLAHSEQQVEFLCCLLTALFFFQVLWHR